MMTPRVHGPCPGRTPRAGIRAALALLPSATETVVALGAADRLVARSRFDRAPAVQDLPSVGDIVRPDLETLLSLKPDLVIVWTGVTDARLVARLEGLGVETFPAEMHSVADVLRVTRELGEALGTPGAGERLADSIAYALARVARGAPPPGDRPRVLLLLDGATFLVAGPDTFLDEILRVAGGRNVFHDAPVAWQTVSPETVVVRDPDAVVFAERPGLRAPSEPGSWAERR